MLSLLRFRGFCISYELFKVWFEKIEQRIVDFLLSRTALVWSRLFILFLSDELVCHLWLNNDLTDWIIYRQIVPVFGVS